jgi:hypothetical protein
VNKKEEISKHLELVKNETIIVTHIGYDEKGWYIITKGDNNNRDDGKIRWEQIKYKTIMIIY